MAPSFKRGALAVLILSSGLHVPAIPATPITGSSDGSVRNSVGELSARLRADGVNWIRVSEARANRRSNVTVVARGPVRRWVHRRHFGTIVGGIVLGTIIVVDAAGTAPDAPAPNMCWFWTDTSYTQGYWDYCAPPP
jgi:hypothetical protein